MQFLLVLFVGFCVYSLWKKCSYVKKSKYEKQIINYKF